MANKKTLDAQLLQLVADMGHFDVLQKLTNEQERLIMANVYMWWRNARQVDDYLNECYERNSITHNKTRDGLNFNPLLKLCTSGNISSSDLTTWSKALKVLHKDFEAHPRHYAHDPIGSLCNFIKLHGGKTGLAGYHVAVDDEEDLTVAGVGLYTLHETEHCNKRRENTLIQNRKHTLHYQHCKQQLMGTALSLLKSKAMATHW